MPAQRFFYSTVTIVKVHKPFRALNRALLSFAIAAEQAGSAHGELFSVYVSRNCQRLIRGARSGAIQEALDNCMPDADDPTPRITMQGQVLRYEGHIGDPQRDFVMELNCDGDCWGLTISADPASIIFAAYAAGLLIQIDEGADPGAFRFTDWWSSDDFTTPGRSLLDMFGNAG